MSDTKPKLDSRPLCHDFETRMTIKIADCIKGQLMQKWRLCVQPKPAWVPRPVWDWLLGRVLRLEQFIHTDRQNF